jgi:hypothetical protein
MSYDDEDDNGDDLGAAKGDRLAAILIHVGATRKGIKRLERDVAEVKDRLDNTVTASQCHEKHGQVIREVELLKGDIRAIKKGTTGTAYPAVSLPNAAQARAAALATENTGPIVIPTPERRIEELLEERKERTRRSLTFWLGLIVAASTIIGGLVFGLIKAGRFLDRVDRSVEATSQRAESLQEEMRRELSRMRAPVIVRVPMAPDGGTGRPAAAIAPQGGRSRPRPRP